MPTAAGTSETTTIPLRSHRSHLSVWRVTAFASVATTLLGVGTSKIIAITTGPEGIALIGLYRNLTAFISIVLSLEMANVLIQRMSTAPSASESRAIVRSAWAFFVLQLAVLLLVSIFGAPLVATWLFGVEKAVQRLLEVRIVLILVAGTLALQTVTALLSGRAKVQHVTIINLVTSLLTVLSVYPLLLLGSTGIAMIVGLTCLLGAIFGSYFVAQEYALTWSDLRLRLREFSSLPSLPASFLLTLRTIICTSSLLIVQSLINRYYTLHDLGFYNSAILVENAFVMMLMSAMKPYFLPVLGQMHTAVQQRDFANSTLKQLLGIVVPCTIGLIFISHIIAYIAFSRQFIQTSSLINVLALSIVPQAFVWCNSMYWLHQKNYKLLLILDSAWAVLFLGASVLAVHYRWSLEAIAAGYVVSHCLAASLYAITYMHHRLSNFSFLNIWWLVVSFTTVLLIFLLHRIYPVASFALLPAVAALSVALLRNTEAHQEGSGLVEN